MTSALLPEMNILVTTTLNKKLLQDIKPAGLGSKERSILKTCLFRIEKKVYSQNLFSNRVCSSIFLVLF